MVAQTHAVTPFDDHPGRLAGSESMGNVETDSALALVERLELELLSPAVRSSAERIQSLLHSDFMEYGASGRVWSRDAMVEALTADPQVIGIPTEIDTARLAHDVILVTYRIAGPRPTLRSSVWIRSGDSWQLRFHQGSVIG